MNDYTQKSYNKQVEGTMEAKTKIAGIPIIKNKKNKVTPL